jgi:iron(III) transport system substrate-binding protein
LTKKGINSHKKEETKMSSMKVKRSKSVFIGCLVTLFLCPLLLVPFGNALAQSVEKHTAKLVEGAKKEGKMVWYAAIGSADAHALLKKFNKTYPFVKTEIYRATGQKVTTRILAEARAKRHIWDVTINGGLSGEYQKRRGLYAKYLSPHRKFFPEGLKDPEGYWTDMFLNLKVIGYNTKIVSPQDVPKAYEDLLDPKWKGKMGMPTNDVYWFANVLRKMGEEKGLEYMKKLAEQNIRFRTGRTLNAQMVAAGEIHFAILVYNYKIEQMKKEGAPVEWVAIDPVKIGTVAEIHPVGVSANAPHPNAARLFADFLLSKEAGELLASRYGVSSRTDVEAIVPRMKKGLNILPFDVRIADDYDRYMKLYREVLYKR